MANRRYYLLENRVICSEFDSQLSIISNPYKSIRYFFLFLLYIMTIAFYTYGLVNYKTITTAISNFSGIWLGLTCVFGGGLIVMYSLNLVPLIISVFKNTFFKNLFFKEELTITKDGLIFKKYDKVKFNLFYKDIRELYLDFQKSEKEFSGVPFLVPNYKPILHLVLVDKKQSIKLFESIKRDEIKYLYEVITEKLIKNGLFFEEYQSKKRISLNVSFLSPTEFYSSSKYLFDKTEIEKIDNNIESLKSEQGIYYSMVIEKFKKNIIHRRALNKISIY